MQMRSVEDIVRDAIRTVAVTGPNGDRTLAYYAGVGIDHFSHDYNNLQVLIDCIAAEVDRTVSAQKQRALKEIIGNESATNAAR
jgi:hypothetical protein